MEEIEHSFAISAKVMDFRSRKSIILYDLVFLFNTLYGMSLSIVSPSTLFNVTSIRQI